jgi:hypothetical protein
VWGEAVAEVSYFQSIPNAKTPEEGAMLVSPTYSIFGSEELSMYAPGIRERAKLKSAGLNK